MTRMRQNLVTLALAVAASLTAIPLPANAATYEEVDETDGAAGMAFCDAETLNSATSSGSGTRYSNCE